MANRNLSPDELKLAKELRKEVRQRLAGLAAGDLHLLFAYRRKIVTVKRWSSNTPNSTAGTPSTAIPR
jgi:hypothetical protein